MLALTKKVDYGLIAMCHLARNPGKVVTARDIAQRYKVPQALLMNVMKALATIGLVRSSRGPRGGYELGKPATSLTLKEIIEGIEGPIRFVQCASIEEDGKSQQCELIGICPVSGPVRRLHQKLDQFLTQVTLAEIAFDQEFGQTAGGKDVAVAIANMESA